MQLQSDPFLGWTTMDRRDYLVRQLNDHKAAIQLESLKAAGLLEYAAVCGEMLARGHARAGDCSMIAGYVGRSPRFDEAVGAFAEAYAKHDARKYADLVEQMVHRLFDRDTSPGAEAEDLLKLDIPALIVPGRDESHATSAARYLEECLPKSQYWDVLPEQQTEATAPDRLLDFLQGVSVDVPPRS